MFNRIEASVFTDREVYLFGAGKIGKATLEYLDGFVQVRGILDNRKKEIVFAGEKRTVMHPSAVWPAENTIIIVAILDYESAVEQLKEMGWHESRIFISVSWKIPFEDDLHQTGYEGLTFSETAARNLLEDDSSKLLYDFILDNRGGKVNLYQYAELTAICNREEYWVDVPVPENPVCAVLDCGAYEGDSIVQILNAISPKQCTYYAFEPDDHVIPFLEETEKRVTSTGTKIRFVNIRKGVWLRDAELVFNYHSEDAASTLSDNRNLESDKEGIVQVTSIDSIDVPEKILFIKMDIEGSEAAAIRGAERTIREKRPFLAVCAYHRPSDLYMLPALIKEINPDYKIYLRGGLHYTYYAIDAENVKKE